MAEMIDTDPSEARRGTKIAHNKIIRNKLYGIKSEYSKFLPLESLYVIKNPIMKIRKLFGYTDTNEVLANINELISVDSIDIIPASSLYELEFDKNYMEEVYGIKNLKLIKFYIENINLYKLNLICSKTSKEIEGFVVEPESIDYFEGLKNVILLSAKNEKERFNRSLKWDTFYKLNDINNSVRYSYAITANASQGMTFKGNHKFSGVYVNYSDIMSCKDYYERNRRLYVAASRSDKLWIIQD